MVVPLYIPTKGNKIGSIEILSWRQFFFFWEASQTDWEFIIKRKQRSRNIKSQNQLVGQYQQEGRPTHSWGPTEHLAFLANASATTLQDRWTWTKWNDWKTETKVRMSSTTSPYEFNTGLSWEIALITEAESPSKITFWRSFSAANITARRQASTSKSATVEARAIGIDTAAVASPPITNDNPYACQIKRLEHSCVEVDFEVALLWGSPLVMDYRQMHGLGFFFLSS